MLVHLCCSVDAGYFLQKLQEKYPQERLIAYFYDPNIHPYSEYKLRMLDTKRVCDKLGVEFIEGEYDYLSWLNAVKGKENAPEKGQRCSICFMHSLESTAKLANALNEKTITTSLLMSPKKSQSQLAEVAEVIKKLYGVEFVIEDFRKKGGTQNQQVLAKEMQMYRQDYCGCIFGLLGQKKDSEVIDELISPVTKQVLPASIEERFQLYQKRIELEEKGIKYKIIKENFLNYRLLRGGVKKDKKTVESYILFYSYLKRPTKGRVEYGGEGVFYFNRMQIILCDIEKFNEVLKKRYENVKDLIKNPPSVEEELTFRRAITNTPYSLTPIIILDEIEEKYEINIEAKIYPDVREILIEF